MVSHARLSHGVTTAGDRTFELVQFTSGTTGPPAAVTMSDQSLGSNVGRILSVLDPREGDNTVSWLPLSHDMGLVGMVLASLAGADAVGGGRIVLMQPEDFIRTPDVWLRAIAEWRGTVTAAPDFGYRIAARTGFRGDLSPLRCAIVGGEVVRSSTLQAFAHATKDCGFEPAALCPAYGLAEVGVAATLTPPGVHWRDSPVERLSRRPDNRSDSAARLVSSGPPLPGHRVRAGKVSEEAERIEIVVEAPTGPRIVPTGDLGFTDEDGWLYVTGRDDDFVVLHGRNTYAPVLEEAIECIPGVRAGHVALSVMPTGEVVVLCEVEEDVSTGQRSAIAHEIRRTCVQLALARPDQVQFVDRGVLPFTTSGKLQRSRLSQIAGHLG
jgi:acyl-CoA synthetase (AMP-forming)/AMP-acid ligase II